MKKYEEIRAAGGLRTGDIMLCYAKKPIGDLIRHFDTNDGEHAYYNHSLVIYEAFGRWYCMDSHPIPGVNPEFLSCRIEKKKYTDFMILRPKFTETHIAETMSKLMDATAVGIKYDIFLLARIALFNKFNVDVKWLGDPSKMICSEFTAKWAEMLGSIHWLQEAIDSDWITPHGKIWNPNIDFEYLYDERINRT